MRARDALKEAERFLRHTRVAKAPDAMEILRDARDKVAALGSSVKVALDAWDDEHRVT